jgi:hypothetical protein
LDLSILEASKSKDEYVNHLATIENYIEKYLPISIQYQIGETMFSILPENLHNRVSNFQKTKFEYLNEVVLNDTGIPDILS